MVPKLVFHTGDNSINRLSHSRMLSNELNKLFKPTSAIELSFIITLKYFVQYLKLYLAGLLPAGRISDLE